MKFSSTHSLIKLTFAAIAIASLITISVGFNAFSENPSRSIYQLVEDNKDWMRTKDDVKISVQDVVSTYKSQLGLTDLDKLVEIRTDIDVHGNSHARFQHLHKNVKVEGSQLLVHSRNELVYLVNGTLIRNLDATINVNVDKSAAIEKAKSMLTAEIYMWESEYAEKLIKDLQNNPRATFYPEANLVFVHPSYDRNSTEYILAYDITIHSMVPERKKRFFIDAANGNLILEINDLHTGSTPGTAATKYHGIKSITTDSISMDSFRLVDTIRGNGVFTRNAQSSTNLMNSVDFYDDDNYWDNVNDKQDEVAGDVHFGAETTFDFYGTLGQIGLNDTLPFLSFVHVDNNWTNATWNGMFARFGDAESPDSPLAALDVVGHEFTHGLTDFTADLVYMNEPGGLNESFSDIFGTAIEFYGDIESADWLIGEDFIATGGFRSMSDPNSMGDPDTYFGDGWITGSGDNGGVHTNSGVQNYWFYILSEGAIGTNDNGDDFDVEGISIDSSIRVAYGNLKNYLMVNSQYSDARLGGIQASEDYFGACSNQVVQTTNAWYAVGVGNIFPRTDIELLDLVGPDSITCGVSDKEFVRVLMRFNDCSDSLQLGTSIPMYYTIDGTDTVFQDLVLAETLFDLDSLEFIFTTPIAQFIDPGTYVIEVGVDYELDNSVHNDKISDRYNRIYAQNTDMALQEVSYPVSSCFMAEESIALKLSFEGCDSIVAGEMMEVQYRIDNGDWVTEIYALENTLYRGDEIIVEMADSYDFSETQVYDIDAMLIYEADTLLMNNLSSDNVVENPDALQFRVVMTFEGDETEAMDSFYVNKGSEVQQQILDGVGFQDTRGLRTTGNNGAQDMVDGKIDKLKFEDLWTEGLAAYTSETCFCADLTTTDSARLRFRINQTYSPIYNDLYESDLDFASSLRLMLNGVQNGNVFTALKPENNPHFNLNINVTEYVGAPLEICFQTSTLTSKENDPYEIGDNIHIDNVVLLADVYVATEEVEFENKVSIYPNPTNDLVSIKIDNMDMRDVSIQLFDINGQLVTTNFRSISEDRIRLDLNALASGIYLVRLLQDDKVAVAKIIRN